MWNCKFLCAVVSYHATVSLFSFCQTSVLFSPNHKDTTGYISSFHSYIIIIEAIIQAFPAVISNEEGINELE